MSKSSQRGTPVRRRRPPTARLTEWKALLDEAADRYERPDFLEEDPLSIPHRFSDPEDIAIAGFLAASLAWGNRKSILRSCEDLLDRMDGAPADFVRSARDVDLKAFDGFVHRTFQEADAKRFIRCLHSLNRDGGLEGAFTSAFAGARLTPVPDVGLLGGAKVRGAAEVGELGAEPTSLLVDETVPFERPQRDLQDSTS